MARIALIFAACIFVGIAPCSARHSQDLVQGSPPSPADDLTNRLEAAMDARNSGDPVRIRLASAHVIALGLVEMAKLRLDEKAYSKALRLCEESLEFEDTAQTRVELAIASLYGKNVSEAIKHASSATELDPQNALAWTIKGEALVRSEDYSGAAAALAKAVEIKPDTESVYALGMAQLGMKDKEAAAKSFNRFLALTGDSAWSRVLAGRAYHEQGFAQEAQEQYENALLLDPRTPNAHYFWALSLLRENAWSPTDEVYAHLGKELRLNPRHFEANYMLGSLAAKTRDYKESDQYLHLASQVKPSVPETWVLLGLNAQHRHANHTAETYFRKAIELSRGPDSEEHLEVRKAYFGLGRLLMASGRAREGKELLIKAQQLENQVVVEEQNKIAATRGTNNQQDGGTAAPHIPGSDSESPQSPPLTEGSEPVVGFLSAHQPIHSPSDPAGKSEKHLGTVLGATFNDLATAEALLERYQDAFKHYHEAERWNPQIPGLQRNLGLAAYFAGQSGEAIRLLAKIVVQTPGDAHARAVLGLAYFATTDYTKAVQTISPIANQALEDPQLGFAWAKSLTETGNRAGAARALQEIGKADANPGVERLIQFGQLWQELGDNNHAAESFRRALLIDPENADAKCGLRLAKCP